MGSRHNLHNVLEAACKALRIDPAVYDTGMKPVLYNPTYVALAVWIAERAAPAVDATAKEKIEKLLPVARRLIVNGKLEKEANLRLHQSGREIDASNAGAAIVSGLTTDMIEASINNVCGKGARAAAAAAAGLLGRPFLEELATEIVRLDAVTLVERQELPVDSNTITASLWRGTTGVKVTHTIVLLEDGSHGLIAKTKGRWTWLHGTRDDILSSVPDGHMESAVAAVAGGGGGNKNRTTTSSPAVEIRSRDDDESSSATGALPGKLGGVAMGTDGRIWAASKEGRLFEWTKKREVRTADAGVGAVRGMDAGGGNSGVVVTWGNNQLTKWTDLRPESIADAAEGAFVRDDGSIIWWQDDQIHFGKKKTKGLVGQRLSICRRGGGDSKNGENRNGYVIAVAPTRCVRFDLDGVRIGEIALEAASAVTMTAAVAVAHALSPDGERIATYKEGSTSARSILVSSTADGKTLLTLTVDSGHIDGVVFAHDKHILVRYHEKKRVAVFDARGGGLVHRVQARDLGGRGSAVEELFPLLRGAILAFAPYPKGETLLLGYDAQLIKRWELDRFYKNGTSLLADAGDHTVFAHFRDSTRVLRF